MKRLIAAMVLIVVVLTAYIGGYLYINSTCEKTVDLLKACVADYQNGKDVQSSCNKLEKFWSDRESTLSLFTNHSAIDEIELSIEAFSVHSQYPDNEMFYEYNSKLETLIHQLMEDTVPGMHSIF